MTLHVETIVRISRAQRAEAAAVLTGAFVGDEVFSTFFPTVDDRYKDRVAALFAWSCEFHEALGMPFLTAVEDGRVVGVATVQEPHRYRPPALPTQFWRLSRGALASWRVGLRASRLMRRYADTAARLHPPPPFHYLGNIAVRTSSQGRGIGSRLLGSAHELACARSDSTGLVLDTINVRFAQSLGRRGWRVRGPSACGPLSTFSCFLSSDPVEPQRDAPD